MTDTGYNSSQIMMLITAFAAISIVPIMAMYMTGTFPHKKRLTEKINHQPNINLS